MKKVSIEYLINNNEWEMVLTEYADDYMVFREVGIKTKETVWLHVHDNWTGIFINEHQFLRTVSYREELEYFLNALREPLLQNLIIK